MAKSYLDPGDQMSKTLMYNDDDYDYRKPYSWWSDLESMMEEGEVLETIRFGLLDYYDDEFSSKWLAKKEMKSEPPQCLASKGNISLLQETEDKEDAKKELTRVFDPSHGRSYGTPFILWTDRYVYFAQVYDGSEEVWRVPRNPCGDDFKIERVGYN